LEKMLKLTASPDTEAPKGKTCPALYFKEPASCVGKLSIRIIWLVSSAVKVTIGTVPIVTNYITCRKMR